MSLTARLEGIGHGYAASVDQRLLLTPTRERHLLLLWLAQRYDRELADQLIKKDTQYSDFLVFADFYRAIGFIEEDETPLSSGDSFIHAMIDFLEASDVIRKHKEHSESLIGPQKLMDASIQGQSQLFSKSLKIIPPEISIVCDTKASRPDSAVLRSMLEAIQSESHKLKHNIQNIYSQKHGSYHPNTMFNQEVLLSLNEKLSSFHISLESFMDLFNREIKVWAVPSMLARQDELFGDIASKTIMELTSLKQYLAELNTIQASQNKIAEALMCKDEMNSLSGLLNTAEIEDMIHVLEEDVDVLRRAIMRRSN